MAVYIKNIILYDPMGAVVGFIEIRPMATKTHLRFKHSLSGGGLLLSVMIDGVNKVFPINGDANEYILESIVDLNYEVFACIVRKIGQNMVSLASGAINLNKLRRQQVVQEIDAAMKSICHATPVEVGRCEQCPYRDYFFTQAQ